MDQQLRDELVSVLAEYGNVTMDAATMPRDNAIAFYVHGKRILYPYDQANLNARTDLRRKLRELGAIEKAQTAPQATAPPPPPPTVAAPSPPLPEEDEADVDVPPESDNGCTIVQSGRVIGIEFNRTVTIRKGFVLVFPKHNPNVFVEMPSTQYHILFDEPHEATPAPSLLDTREVELASPLQEVQPQQVIQPPPRPQSDDVNDIVAYLGKRNGAVKSVTIANDLHKTIKSIDSHLRRMRNRGLVECPQPGFWTLTAQSVTTRTSPTVFRSTTTVPPQQPEVLRSREGTSPQVGRILAAMAYATKTTGKVDLTTAMVAQHLYANDGHQYGARIPEMLKKGIVVRGLSLPGVRGWHHQITPKGLAIVKKLGAWPYERDKHPTPEWLAHL
jgi:hypothetical protein